MTARAKKTGWFPASINPVRPGVYEGRFGSSNTTERFLWTGVDWRFPENGMKPTLWPLYCDSWRGLARKP